MGHGHATTAHVPLTLELTMMDSVDIEVTKKQLKGFKIGDEVTITTKGKIKALRDGYQLEACCGDCGPEEIPPRIEISVASTKVQGKTVDSELFDNEDS